jgi:hypothetical protein
LPSWRLEPPTLTCSLVPSPTLTYRQVMLASNVTLFVGRVVILPSLSPLVASRSSLDPFVLQFVSQMTLTRLAWIYSCCRCGRELSSGSLPLGHGWMVPPASCLLAQDIPASFRSAHKGWPSLPKRQVTSTATSSTFSPAFSPYGVLVGVAPSVLDIAAAHLLISSCILAFLSALLLCIALRSSSFG